MVRPDDTSKHKQFRRGIDQLDHEGVIQVMRSDLRGDQAPVLGAVGPMQFEVVEDRMTHEFGVGIHLDALPYQLARRTDPASAEILGHDRQVEVLTRSDGMLLALFSTPWRLRNIERDQPGLLLADLTL